jgi:hypothetical protein
MVAVMPLAGVLILILLTRGRRRPAWEDGER